MESIMISIEEMNKTENIMKIMMFVFLIISIITIILTIISSLKKNRYKNTVLSYNIPTNFEKIYNDLYTRHIFFLEQIRKQVKYKYFIGYIICIVLSSMIFLPIFSISFPIGLFFISIFLFISFTFFNKSFNKKIEKPYKEYYKKEIIPNIINLINKQLKYMPIDFDQNKVQADYKQAIFDNNSFNIFHADDYIEGFIDDETFINICDLHIQNESGTGKNYSIVDIFKGIFVHTKFHRDIESYIRISKNEKRILKQYNKVEMDSLEFEKYFDVYSENKILSMQLLTSDIMESILDFQNKYGLDFEIIIRNNTIYMRFFTGSMFEPKIFKNSMDKDLLFIYYSILQFIIDITKKVNKTLKEVEI